MRRLRTRTVSTKVSEDGYAMVEQLAGDQMVYARLYPPQLIEEYRKAVRGL